jgi:hypothetical protein
MPKHKKGESRDDWMARCIPYVIEKEGLEQKEAAGKCGGMYDSWKKANMSEPETYDLSDVEIFAAGKWRSANGTIHEFSIDDLHDIVNNFNELKGQADPAIKIGHDDKQEIAKNLGLFSLGWPDNLRVIKDKIIGDLKKIPSKLYKIVKNGGLKRVSPEIAYNYQAQPGGKVYKKFLQAVALLGTEQKAMKSLKDIVNVYSEGNVNDISLELDFETAVFTEGVIDEDNNKNHIQEVTDMELKDLLDEKKAELKEMKGKFSESESKVKNLTDDLGKSNSKIETLEAENKELKEKVANFTEEAKKKEISDYVDEKVKEGKIPAALADDYVVEFSDFSDEKLESMKKLLDKTPSVDFGEHSIDTSEKDEPDEAKIDKETGDEIENEDKDKKVKAYMKEHDVDYITADERLREQEEI